MVDEIMTATMIVLQRDYRTYQCTGIGPVETIYGNRRFCILASWCRIGSEQQGSWSEATRLSSGSRECRPSVS